MWFSLGYIISQVSPDGQMAVIWIFAAVVAGFGLIVNRGRLNPEMGLD